MLSDVTNDYVIYLSKKNNKTTIQKITNNIFAGNIFDIYYENMFIEDTIGEFSRKKIDYYIGIINNKKATIDDIKNFKQIVEVIGDDLLKSLLIEKIRKYETNKIR